MDTWPTCKHRLYGTCEIASILAQTNVSPTLADCLACDQTPNIITISLARAYDKTIPPEKGKVGSNLKTMFSWFIEQPANCSCSNRAAVMDVWGVDKCIEYQSTILSWLRESALDNNYPYNDFVVSSLLRSYLLLYKKTH